MKVESKNLTEAQKESTSVTRSRKGREQILTQYSDKGNTIRPTIKTVKTIEAGIYQMGSDMSGPYYERHDLVTDDLLRFEDERHTIVIKEIAAFWDMKDDFDEVGFVHKRGVLLYGAPGTGKSCLLKLIMQDMVEQDDVVFITKSPYGLVDGLKAFREVEENRKALVILEDIDEMVRYNEHAILEIFDGDNQVENVLFLATTNYVMNLPPRILRAGRFDRKVEITNPPEEGRYAYLKNKLERKGLTDKEVRELAKKTDNFSFGQLREFVISSFIYKYPQDETIERIHKGLEGGTVSVSESVLFGNDARDVLLG